MGFKYNYYNNQFHMPSINTELYCYIFMILNTIAQDWLHYYSKSEYYSYLLYLRNLGYKYELLDCFSRIYTGADNKSPCAYLEQIPKDIRETHYSFYRTKIKRKVCQYFVKTS